VQTAPKAPSVQTRPQVQQQPRQAKTAPTVTRASPKR
jgi:hypothetical protein